MLLPPAPVRLSIPSESTGSRLYPPVEPYETGYMQADAGHAVYWEACGNPKGKPALFLHGGPGGACTSLNRRFFDPQRYRIILFDQRGCGRSRPHAALEANTTAHLLADIERLRILLGVDRWLLFGGSWGATLALAYAQAFPGRVTAMVLRGVFTARQKELRWLYQEGASLLFPEAWADFRGAIPTSEREDVIGAYYRRLTCGDPHIELVAARSWCAWEEQLTTLRPCRDDGADCSALLALARIEAHYFRHGAFLREGQLIAEAERLRGIPGVIVQGRYDMVTPAVTAWELARVWEDATLHVVDAAGHASTEPGILQRLIEATDLFSGA